MEADSFPTRISIFVGFRRKLRNSGKLAPGGASRLQGTLFPGRASVVIETEPLSTPALQNVALPAGGRSLRHCRFRSLTSRTSHFNRTRSPTLPQPCPESNSGNPRPWSANGSSLREGSSKMMYPKSQPIMLRNMELKYCERCGRIWLRRSGTERTHCASCARAEASLLMGAPVSFLRLWSRLRAEVQA
jgi:hypothetical protein